MNDEEAFLGTIQENKADLAPRLVYADWLEERGDSRSDLIRIEEEMRRLPVFSDRFWELKPERNQLRSQTPATWLEAMNYTRHSQLIFAHGIPDGWKERWRLIREFTERWHNIPMGDVGGREKDIAFAELELGRKIVSPSLREWVNFAHEVRDTDLDCVLHDDYCLAELDELSAISILRDYDSRWFSAIRHSDLDKTDPPVWFFEATDEPDNQTPTLAMRYLIENTITSAILNHVIQCLALLNLERFSTEVADPTRLTEELRGIFPIPATFDCATYFEDENFLVRLSPVHGKSTTRLQVTTAKSLTYKQIPVFLWEYTLGYGAFGGIFCHRRRNST